MNTLWTVQAPRQVEGSDTHQYIQRHDPEHKRRKNKKNAPLPAMDEEEGAVVAVEALRIFLKKIIHPGENQFQSAARPLKANESAQQLMNKAHAAAKRPLNASGAPTPVYAASLYRTVGATAQKEHSVLLETTDTGYSGPNLDIGGQDIRAIRLILDDLKILSERGVEYLQLAQAPSFLESIQNAVKSARTALPPL